MQTPIDVAVGVLVKPSGEVLMAQRPEGKPYAGYWEFPGGKVELGEPIPFALKREFKEELGIDIDLNHIQPWCGCAHTYPHAHVRLHFYLCRAWEGEPRGLEGQQLAWQNSRADVQPILPATIPLLDLVPKHLNQFFGTVQNKKDETRSWNPKLLFYRIVGNRLSSLKFCRLGAAPVSLNKLGLRSTPPTYVLLSVCRILFQNTPDINSG
jgi:8-oxo-dGTP diphosphatase